jgi:hypothetical protein
MMRELIRLAEVPEYEPQRSVRVADGNILCSTCGKAADTLHLVPDDGDGHYLKAGCEDHDPGWYWITIEDLAARLEEWLPHLAEKQGHMLEALVQGLGEDGLKLIIEMRSFICRIEKDNKLKTIASKIRQLTLLDKQPMRDKTRG